MAGYLQIIGIVILMSLAIQARPKFYDEQAPRRYKRIHQNNSPHYHGLNLIRGPKNEGELLEKNTKEFDRISGSKNGRMPNPEEWNGEIPEVMPNGHHLCPPGVDCQDVELQPNEVVEIFSDAKRDCWGLGLLTSSIEENDLDHFCRTLEGREYSTLFEVCVTEADGYSWKWKFSEDNEQTYLQCQDLGRDLKEIRSEIQDAKYNQLQKEVSKRCQNVFFDSPFPFLRQRCNMIRMELQNIEYERGNYRSQFEIDHGDEDRIAAKIPDIDFNGKERMV